MRPSGRPGFTTMLVKFDDGAWVPKKSGARTTRLRTPSAAAVRSIASISTRTAPFREIGFCGVSSLMSGPSSG